MYLSIKQNSQLGVGGGWGAGAMSLRRGESSGTGSMSGMAWIETSEDASPSRAARTAPSGATIREETS